MPKLLRVFSLLVCLLSLAATHLPAQTQASTGQIAGSVHDASGAVLPSARVTAKNAQTGLQETAITSQDGLFRIVLLPAGTYSVTAGASGFADAVANDVVVAVGRVAQVNLTLAVGAAKEVVTVTEEAVQVTRSEPDALLNSTAISELPINGRRFQDFVTLTPTAQVEPQRNQISMAGQRGIYGANVNIDGMDYNQPFFGGIRGGERSNNAFTIPQESIREFQVVAAGYSPEFGRSTGGVVTAITKSGTNDFHGSAFYGIRHKDLARSNEFFDTLARQPSLQGREVVLAPTQQLWGGSFGGPVRREKVFFFGAYEQQRVRNNRAVVFTDLIGFTPPASCGCQEAINFYQSLQTSFTATNDAKAFLGRADFQFSNTQRLNVRYSRSTNDALNANAAGNAIFPTTISAISNNGTEGDGTHTVVGQLASFFGTALANELRGQYTYESRPRQANALSPTVETRVGRFGTVSFLPTTEFDWRFQIADNLTWTTGNHTAKLGGEYNRLFVDQSFGFNQFGRFFFVGATGASISGVLDVLSLGGSIPNRFDSTDVRYVRQLGNLKASYSVDQIGFFVQDSWRIYPTFTLNYGLRWEGQLNPTPQANNTSLISRVQGLTFPGGFTVDPTNIPQQLRQFAPRLGFAWDPFHNGKTVVRGFGGIYYAPTPLLLFAGPVNNFRTPPGDLSIQLPLTPPAGNPNNTVYKQLQLIGVNLNTFTLDKLPVLTPAQVQSVATALGITFDPNAGVQPIAVSPSFANPRSYQAGFGVEHELLPGWTAGVDLDWVQTVRLERNRDINIPLPVIRATDPAQRPYYGVVRQVGQPFQSRPVPSISSLQLRESSAHALYRTVNFRTSFRRKRVQVGAYYTLSENLSDDDNERDAGGVFYEDAFDIRRREYNFSRLDRKHQFVASPVVFLPWGFEVSSAVRLRSGRPIDALMGFDANGDNFNTDRPYSAPGVPFKRNAFRNKAVKTVDLRAQKSIRLGEKVKVAVFTDFFNLFNAMNIELDGPAVQNYCASPVPANCGFGTPTNLNFLQLRDQRPGASQGQLLLSNNPGAPFQMQVGLRFTF